MKSDELNRYLLAKPQAEEDYPFGPEAQVFKVLGKMFALVWYEGKGDDKSKPRINLKCDPEQAIELRYVFEEVIPGYHMNKKHWNTVKLDGKLPDSEIQRMIDHSYQRVIQGLPKAKRKGLEVQLAASLDQ